MAAAIVGTQGGDARGRAAAIGVRDQPPPQLEQVSRVAGTAPSRARPTWVSAFTVGEVVMGFETQDTALGELNPGALRSLIEHCDDAVILLDAAQRITWSNAAATRLLRCDRAAVIGQAFPALFAERHRRFAANAMTRFLRGATTARTLGGIDSELRGCRADGSEFVPEFSMVRTEDVETPVIMVFLRDRTAWHDREQALDNLAHTDSLTGALNRRGFTDAANAVLDASMPGTTNALLIVDIDNFKAVNDTYGHPAGDVVITTVVARVSERCRGPDLIARWGGEEFIVLLQGADAGAARDMSERIRRGISDTPIRTSGTGHHVGLTASIGISIMRGRERTLEALIAGADEALYRAKTAGGDCVRCQDPTRDPESVATSNEPDEAVAPDNDFNGDVAEALAGPMRTYFAVFQEGVRTLSDLQATATRHYTSLALAPTSSANPCACAVYGRQ